MQSENSAFSKTELSSNMCFKLLHDVLLLIVVFTINVRWTSKPIRILATPPFPWSKWQPGWWGGGHGRVLCTMHIPVTSPLKQNIMFVGFKYSKTYFYYKHLSLGFSYSKPCYLSIIASTETKITNVAKSLKINRLYFWLHGWLFFPIDLLIHSFRSFGLEEIT